MPLCEETLRDEATARSAAQLEVPMVGPLSSEPVAERSGAAHHTDATKNERFTEFIGDIGFNGTIT
jgi:hypothetical protein